MLTTNEIDVIGNLLNTTWGKASTTNEQFPLATAKQYSLSANLQGGTAFDDPEYTDKCNLIVKYMTVVTFCSDQEAAIERRKFKREAVEMCASAIKQLKVDFKDVAGRALKIKQEHDNDGFEVFYTGSDPVSHYTSGYHGSFKRAYYRYTVTYDVA